MRWHYVEGSQAVGPVSVEELERLYKSGVINAKTLIWTEGMKGWQALIACRASFRKTPPPPVPSDDQASIIENAAPSIVPSPGPKPAGRWPAATAAQAAPIAGSVSGEYPIDGLTQLPVNESHDIKESRSHENTESQAPRETEVARKNSIDASVQWIIRGIQGILLLFIITISGVIPAIVAFFTYKKMRKNYGIIISSLVSLLITGIVTLMVIFAIYNSKERYRADLTGGSQYSSTGLEKNTSFGTARLAYDISLDVPSHWTSLPLEARKNLGASGQAMMENAGIERSSARKEPLLAMNATPDPTGAMIRVSVTSPSDYTQSDLAVASPADLNAVGAELLGVYRQVEQSGGPRILEMEPVRIEQINNYRALVISYIRAGVNGPSPWHVAQYKIPVSNRLIELTLSHRQSDAATWRPILERVKRSVKF